MSDAPLLVAQEGGVVTATLNRPDKLNALNRPMLETLTEAVRAFAVAPEQRVLLIRAAGRYFCAGADLLGGDESPQSGGTAAVRQWYRSAMGPGMHALYDELERIEKPVVVAHQGPCVGGGLELSLACDFRLAARAASYRFPEAKFAALPAAGGISRLTRLVGPHWAKWALMADQPIAAERALAIGLVHDVWEDDGFDARVAAFCADLAARPPEMMAMAKLTIGLMAEVPPEQARGIERLGQSILHVGTEMQDLLARMRERLAGPK